MQVRIPIVSVVVLALTGAFYLSRSPAAETGATAVHVSVGGQGSDWTADKLSAQFTADIKPIDYTLHGQKHRARALPLVALLKVAGASMDLKMDPKADPKTKNLPLREIVIIRSRDGYTVTFSLPELLPGVGNRAAWLALDVDSTPLPQAETPVRLIVPDDAVPGRWVRGIGEISVVDVSAIGAATR